MIDPWFVPSLIPILGIAAALGASLVTRRPGLAAWCFSVVAWALSLLLAALPETRPLGERALMVGFFIPAAYLHAVAEDLGWAGAPRRAFYAAAAAMTAIGAAVPGLFLQDAGASPGPLFPLMFALAAAVSIYPLAHLARALRGAREGARERLRYLLLAGFLGCFGGGVNILSTLSGDPGPLGLYMVLASLALLAWVAQAAALPDFGRFVERSLRYSVAAALLSTAWLLLAWAPLQEGAARYPWGAGFVLFMAVLAGQPLLARARGVLAARLFPGQGDVVGMARALAESEARAEHAGRLAEIGALAGAVAHEVRNPLGVITACAAVIERQGGDPDAVAEIREQVDRAARFADALLEYGRPAPPTLRAVALADVVAMAASEVQRALGIALDVQIRGDATIQADLGQLARLLGILIENAAVAGAGAVAVEISVDSGAARIHLGDDGPGVPQALRGRLFEPFVTGRGRAGPRPGTGLGLAIARGVVERHAGTIALVEGASALGGAAFEISLPVEPPLPAGPG